MIQIKNAHELAAMRRACAISAAALRLAGESIEAGMTTADLDKILFDYIEIYQTECDTIYTMNSPVVFVK